MGSSNAAKASTEKNIECMFGLVATSSLLALVGFCSLAYLNDNKRKQHDTRAPKQSNGSDGMPRMWGYTCNFHFDCATQRD